MRVLRLLMVFLLAVPTILWAAITPVDLPATSKWYFHADLNEMRSTPAGRQLYAWLEKEVFEEVRAETGIELGKETDRVTAFAGSDEQIIVVVDGSISQKTKDQLLALGASSGSLDELGSGAGAYYHVKVDESGADDGDDEIDIEPFENGAYFSFAVKGKVIVTSTEDDMKAMLASKGRAARGNNPDGTLLVLSADNSLVQAGVNTGDLAGEIGWDSNIVRNTKQLALLIADEGGMVAIQAQLLAAEQQMAESLASIVRGLISLQVFNDEMDPQVSKVLQSTEVEVDGTRLLLKVKLDPEVVVAALDD